MDSLLAPFDLDSAPGAIVAVVRGGEVVYVRAVGMADLTHSVDLAPGMRSNVGSTAKQFTAYAVARLAAEGRLSLDDDVRAHLPELPDLGETVTLRHLLTHTSGYREFLNALALAGYRFNDGDHIAPDAPVRVVQRQPALQNAPGEEWNYNNTGYALAARVVEAVTGESFPVWMAAHVFGPVGMHDTAVRARPGEVVPHSARGYVPDGDGGFREGTDIGAAMGAGGVYSTAADLARWMRHLAAGLDAGDPAVDAMTTRYVLASGDTTAYGLGLFVDRERGQRRIHHGGADLAHRADFVYYPDLDAGVILLSNHAAFPMPLVREIVDAFFGEAMEPHEADPAPAAEAVFVMDPAAFDRLAGRYELEAAPGFVLTFWREGERLLTRATGQPEIELTATSDSTLAIPQVNARLTFHADARGTVTGLTLHQNGHHAARRLADEPAAPIFDPAPLTGRYYSEELETSYTVHAEDGVLVVRHARLEPVALEHRAGDTFIGSFPIVEVVFDRDEGGGVTGFRAGNGRTRNVLFERAE